MGVGGEPGRWWAVNFTKAKTFCLHSGLPFLRSPSLPPPQGSQQSRLLLLAPQGMCQKKISSEHSSQQSPSTLSGPRARPLDFISGFQWVWIPCSGIPPATLVIPSTSISHHWPFKAAAGFPITLQLLSLRSHKQTHTTMVWGGSQ